MATIEYMTRGFVHIPDSPPESRWLRLRGPPVESLNLTGGPTTQEEIWQMRFNRQLLSLLVDIWLNEYREGWKLFRIESPFFDVADVFNNGEMVPHYRSVVVFARFAPNTRNLANVNIVRRDGEGVGDGNQDARSRNI